MKVKSSARIAWWPWQGRAGWVRSGARRDDRLQRDVALKVAARQPSGDAKARRRLLAEARAVTALNHPHIVVVHDCR